MKEESRNQPTGSGKKWAALGVGAAAIGLVVTVVLPAEFGVDPTGIGKVLGLTDLGTMKSAQDLPPGGIEITRSDDGAFQMILELPPYQGREVKGRMTAGDVMSYSWQVDGDAVEFEFHGDPDDGGPAASEAYEIATKSEASGELTAPFDGVHGWYWKNLTPRPVIVTADISGEITDFAPVDAAETEEFMK